MTPQRGDEAALYRTHADHLERVVHTRVLGVDHTLIEDACSFAWLQLLRRQPDRESVFPWLVQVATREAWRLGAQDRTAAPLNPDVADSAADFQQQVEFRDLLNTLATLPQRRRNCLTLLISGHTYNEIATATGFSLTAVNKQLVKARHTLRTHGHDLH